MPDEIALQKDMARATKAKQLLESELLQEAFKTLEDGYYAAWRATRLEDQAGRERLFLAANVIGKVRDHLNKVLADGSIAKAELNKLHADADRRKKFGII